MIPPPPPRPGAPAAPVGLPDAVPVRDAATVVLLRDAPAGRVPGGGLEVYLMRRVAGMAFAARADVFPGGGVDRADLRSFPDFQGPDPHSWCGSSCTGPAETRALACAAVRETFEETGVLFAAVRGGVCLPREVLSSPAWRAERAALEAGRRSLCDVLAAAGLVLRTDLLHPWARWVTPAPSPLRYDTRFFLAAPPAGQEPWHLAREADSAGWVRPRQALDDVAAGRRRMLPPTVRTLRDLADYPDVAAALDDAGTFRPEPDRAGAVDRAVDEVPPGGAPGGAPGSAGATDLAGTGGERGWTRS